MTSLVLGTAQWGDAYGVTNAVGRLTEAQIAEIVAVAHSAGVVEVDTARGYGDAEQRLKPYAREFSVTTKVAGGGDLHSQVEESLRTLDIDSLASVLVHDWDSIDCKGHGMSVLGFSELLDQGLVQRAGVSIYDADGLASAVETFDAAGVSLGAVQVPANVLDRRLDDSSLLQELADAGAHVVVRSAFLQGVLLSAGGGLADHPDVARFRSGVETLGSSLLEACLAHVRALPWATHVVVGVTSASELSQLIAAWNGCTPERASESWASDDLDLIDPRRWSR